MTAIDSVSTEPVWCEKYRPQTLKDCILPDETRKMVHSYVEKKEFPALLLSGPAGIGKTTVARAMLNDMGLARNYIIINGSMSGNIDTLRTQIKNFASTRGLDGGRKYVILDEADYLNPQSTQPALRNFMETYSGNCGFILTCNYINNILPELQSRCAHIEFLIPKEERQKLFEEFVERVMQVIRAEGITKLTDKDWYGIIDICQRNFPDMRRILNELQGRIINQQLQTGGQGDSDKQLALEFVAACRSGDPKKAIEWAHDNYQLGDKVFTAMYNYLKPLCKDDISLAKMIVLLGEYQYKHKFVADHQINLAAAAVEIQDACEFKKS